MVPQCVAGSNERANSPLSASSPHLMCPRHTFAATAAAAIPLAAIAEQMRGAPEAATMSWEQLVAVLVFGLAFVNGAPLVIAFGVEAFARRRHPPAKVTPRRAP